MIVHMAAGILPTSFSKMTRKNKHGNAKSNSRHCTAQSVHKRFQFYLQFSVYWRSCMRGQARPYGVVLVVNLVYIHHTPSTSLRSPVARMCEWGVLF